MWRDRTSRRIRSMIQITPPTSQYRYSLYSGRERRKRKNKRLTQKTPIELNEQKGGRSGLIIQNMPCNCQQMKNRMKRWCEYQNRSKWSLRTFSLEKNTIAARQAVMTQPVIPGPVVKLRLRKTRTRWPAVAEASAMANLKKFIIWARMWMTVNATMDQAVSLWKLRALSKGMKSFKGDRRSKEMKLRQTGNKIKATST